MSFEETTFLFDSIQEGEIIEHIYNFKNTGTAPLLINNVTSTCGCTVPDWTREIIHPGEGGEIKIVFDSKKQQGPLFKAITIIANTIPPRKKIFLEGYVEPDK